MNTDIFQEYDCSLGTVIGHQAEPPAYIIRNHGGETISVLANGVPSAEAVESDIANPPAPVVAVPVEVSRPRFMIALRKVLGLNEGAVYAMISQIADEEAQEDVRDWFDHGVYFRRDDGILNAFTMSQGVTHAQLDAVFIHAGTQT